HHRIYEPLDDLRRTRNDRAAAARQLLVLFYRPPLETPRLDLRRSTLAFHDSGAPAQHFSARISYRTAVSVLVLAEMAGGGSTPRRTRRIPDGPWRSAPTRAVHHPAARPDRFQRTSHGHA